MSHTGGEIVRVASLYVPSALSGKIAWRAGLPVTHAGKGDRPACAPQRIGPAWCSAYTPRIPVARMLLPQLEKEAKALVKAVEMLHILY
jgi:hypothetical protein